MSEKYDFTSDYVSYKTNDWLKNFRHFAGKPNLRYLEIGVSEGRSLIWMMENILTDVSSSAVAIDPFELLYETGDGDRFLKNIKNSGFKERVDFRKGFSQEILPTLEKNSFDLIYLDGHPHGPQVLSDLENVFPLLKDNGILIIDDYLFESQQTDIENPKKFIDEWLKKTAGFIVTHNSYQIIGQKKDHFQIGHRAIDPRKLTGTPGFCILPWFTSFTSHNDTILPCANFDRGVINNDSSGTGVLNTVAFKETRKTMVEGFWCSSCSSCANQEKHCGTSPRVEHNKLNLNADMGIDADLILLLESTASDGSINPELAGREVLKSTEFEKDRISYRTETWKNQLRKKAGRPQSSLLDVGPGEGQGIIWLMQNIFFHDSSRAFALETEISERLKQNLILTGLNGRVKVSTGMPEQESFDVIHLNDEFQMTVQSLASYTALLKKGGFLMIDNYLPFKDIIDSWLAERKDLEVKFAHGELIFRKKPGLIIQNKEMTRQELLSSDSFCVLPWIHFHAWPEGMIYPCCRAEPMAPINHYKGQSTNEIANNNKYKKLRLDMLNGDKPMDYCHYCYKHEIDYPEVDSPRIANNKNHLLSGEEINPDLLDVLNSTSADGSIDFQMLHFDIRFSNICNLKCRSCNPSLSSNIAVEELKVNGKIDRGIEYPANGILRVGNISERLLAEILQDQNIEKLTNVYFAGGEPLMTDEHYSIVEKLLERNNTNVRIFYNTNFSRLSYKGKSVLDYWKKFPHLNVGTSIDDFGNRAEYLRHGTRWNITEDNFRKFHAEISESTSKIYNSLTISIFNVFYLPQIIDHLRNELHVAKILLQMVFDPELMSVTVLPKQAKEVVGEKLTSYSNTLGTSKNDQELKQQLKYVMNVMNKTDNSALLSHLGKHTFNHDYVRKESFVDTYPELEALIQLSKHFPKI